MVNGGRWVVNYDELGPGYLSAYGLVAGYFVVPGRTAAATRTTASARTARPTTSRSTAPTASRTGATGCRTTSRSGCTRSSCATGPCRWWATSRSASPASSCGGTRSTRSDPVARLRLRAGPAAAGERARGRDQGRAEAADRRLRAEAVTRSLRPRSRRGSGGPRRRPEAAVTELSRRRRRWRSVRDLLSSPVIAPVGAPFRCARAAWHRPRAALVRATAPIPLRPPRGRAAPPPPLAEREDRVHGRAVARNATVTWGDKRLGRDHAAGAAGHPRARVRAGPLDVIVRGRG